MGYGSTSRVYEQIDGGLGMAPTAYRAGGAGETIVHAVRDTALGPLMMAATERGVCFVQFGKSGGASLTQLQGEFPKAALLPAPAAAAVPLDLRGTAFQIKVWRFLMRVRAGDVVGYSELAAAIGARRAVRAAASACAANRLAVLVPCHRALRADGGLGGYRWGLERRRVLLDLERTQRGGD